MNIARFADDSAEFPVLDLVARPQFRTATSIAFEIGRVAEAPTPGDEEDLEAAGPSLFQAVGWIDVHHPCAGHIKAQLRVQIPADYHAWERQLALVQVVFRALEIPADETFEAHFFDAERLETLVQPESRGGAAERP